MYDGIRLHQRLRMAKPRQGGSESIAAQANSGSSQDVPALQLESAHKEKENSF